MSDETASAPLVTSYDERAQQRTWRIQRIGWATVWLVIVAALFGKGAPW